MVQFIADVGLVVDKDVRIGDRPEVDDGKKQESDAGMQSRFFFFSFFKMFLLYKKTCIF